MNRPVSGPVEKRFRVLEQLPRVSAHSLRYRAEQLDTRREVELRLLPEDAEAEHQRQFRKEVEELLRLDHPAFLPVLDTGESRESPFYVVPLREYVPLARRRNDENFSVEERCLVVRALAAALAAAHRQSILLRPPSPVTLAWDPGTPRLCFVHHRYTEPVKALPLGEDFPASIDRRSPSSDVFHWGLFSYWLITKGHFPYQGGGPQRPIRKVVPELASELAQVIDASVSRDEALRPAHGVEVHLVLLRRRENRVPATGGSEGTLEDAQQEIQRSVQALHREGLIPELRWDLNESGIHARPARKRTSPPVAASPSRLHLLLLGAVIAAALVGGLWMVVPRRSRAVPSPSPTAASPPAPGPTIDPRTDPFLRSLLRETKVDEGNVLRILRLAGRLKEMGRLPPELATALDVEAVRAILRRDPAGACDVLEEWLDEARHFLQE